MHKFSTNNRTVDEIGMLHLEGNVIPHAWYETLRLDNGKPDLVSIVLLSEFVYWYRPTAVRDEQSGSIKGYKKKFKADLLQKSYKNLVVQFGFSEKQIRESLKRLEDKSIVERVFRTVNSASGKLPNTMFIKLNVQKIKELTFPQSKEVVTSEETPYCPTGKEVLPYRETRISPQGKTITDITTKTTTNKRNPDFDESTILFSSWWELYDNKKGKKKAEEAFNKVLKQYPFEVIERGTKNYLDHLKKNGTDKKFMKYPATFLNGEYFNDEYESTAKNEQAASIKVDEDLSVKLNRMNEITYRLERENDPAILEQLDREYRELAESLHG